jgi:hypothetical protein
MSIELFITTVFIIITINTGNKLNLPFSFTGQLASLIAVKTAFKFLTKSFDKDSVFGIKDDDLDSEK